MMEIKLRAWNRIVGRMQYFTLPEIEKQTVPIQWQCLIIMLFTGMHDKNGKEIYQGDIVKVEYGIGKVVFYNYAMFMIEWIDDKEANMESLAFSNQGYKQGRARTDIEVIGNIYENHKSLILN